MPVNWRTDRDGERVLWASTIYEKAAAHPSKRRWDLRGIGSRGRPEPVGLRQQRSTGID